MEHFLSVLWKTIFVFFMLVLLARLIGRKLLTQMNFFDFVIAILIGTIAGSFVTTEVKGYWVLLSPVLLTILVVAMGFVSLKSLPARKLIEGEPVVVVQNGKILGQNMRKLRYNLDDLEMQLRSKNVFNITDVEFAVLEPHGQLSVLKKSQAQPVTMKDLSKASSYKGMATEIIKDGQVLEQNLTQNNLDFGWLYSQLRQQGIQDLSQVTYAALQTDGTLYTDIHEDQLSYVQKVED